MGQSKRTGRSEEKTTIAISSRREAGTQRYFLVSVTQHFVGFAGLGERECGGPFRGIQPYSSGPFSNVGAFREGRWPLPRWPCGSGDGRLRPRFPLPRTVPASHRPRGGRHTSRLTAGRGRAGQRAGSPGRSLEPRPASAPTPPPGATPPPAGASVVPEGGAGPGRRGGSERPERARPRNTHAARARPPAPVL